MNLLLNNENIVVSAGNKNFIYETNGVHEREGNTTTCIYPAYNESNSSIVEDITAEIPPNVIGKYKYIDGEFVRNTQYKETTEDSMFTVFQALDPNIPKTGDIDKRVDKLINFILEIAERPEPLFDIPEDLVEGLKLRSENINSLTGTDLRNYKIGQNYINKMKTRLIIEHNVGDVYYQVANTEKQVDLTYTMNLRTFLLVKNLYDHLSLAIPEAIIPQEDNNNVLADYLYFANLFITMIENEQYFDRIDVDNAEEVINSIIPKKPNLATIVKENYLEKYYIID